MIRPKIVSLRQEPGSDESDLAGKSYLWQLHRYNFEYASIQYPIFLLLLNLDPSPRNRAGESSCRSAWRPCLFAVGLQINRCSWKAKMKQRQRGWPLFSCRFLKASCCWPSVTGAFGFKLVWASLQWSTCGFCHGCRPQLGRIHANQRPWKVKSGNIHTVRIWSTGVGSGRSWSSCISTLGLKEVLVSQITSPMLKPQVAWQHASFGLACFCTSQIAGWIARAPTSPWSSSTSSLVCFWWILWPLAFACTCWWSGSFAMPAWLTCSSWGFTWIACQAGELVLAKSSGWVPSWALPGWFSREWSASSAVGLEPMRPSSGSVNPWGLVPCRCL